MSRIELIDEKNMTPEQKAQYDKFPSNLVRGLLKTKNLTEGYGALGTALRYTDLSAKDREFVILRIGYISKCQYELMQHKSLAMQQGWTKEDIDAISQNNMYYFDERMSIILKFVNECVENIKVSTETFKATKKYLSEAEIAELILLIGHYMMTARFLETLEIDLDDMPTSWENI